MKLKAKHYQWAALVNLAAFVYCMATERSAQQCVGFGLTAFILMLISDAASQP